MFYIGIYFSLLCHFEQLGIQSESGPKWTVLKVDSRPEVDGLEPKWTVMGSSRRSTKSRQSLGINLSIKVNGPNFGLRKCKTGRSKSVKVDGPKVLKLAVHENRALNAL